MRTFPDAVYQFCRGVTTSAVGGTCPSGYVVIYGNQCCTTNDYYGMDTLGAKIKICTWISITKLMRNTICNFHNFQRCQASHAKVIGSRQSTEGVIMDNRFLMNTIVVITKISMVRE